jgi:hypothetical protein
MGRVSLSPSLLLEEGEEEEETGEEERSKTLVENLDSFL